MRRTALLLVVVLTLGLAVACNKARSDSALVTDVKTQMFSNTDLKNAAIEVTAQNGEVTLSGQVASDAVRYAGAAPSCCFNPAQRRKLRESQR